MQNLDSRENLQWNLGVEISFFSGLWTHLRPDVEIRKDVSITVNSDGEMSIPVQDINGTN
eukprot:8966536-Pyramimonas_sp.AAC.1